jgi:hypothetical protein
MQTRGMISFMVCQNILHLMNPPIFDLYKLWLLIGAFYHKIGRLPVIMDWPPTCNIPRKQTSSYTTDLLNWKNKVANLICTHLNTPHGWTRRASN